MIKFLEIARKLFKSLGKYEYKILDKIIFLKSKNKYIHINDNDILNIQRNLDNEKYHPKKIAITICFHFNKKKIKNLIKVCSQINEYAFSKHVTIVTNKIKNNEYNLLKRILKKTITSFNITQIEKNPEPNLLPWFCFNILKKKYNEKSFSHYLFLEGDILINSQNINYWIYSRNILKKHKMIPSFLRYELYKKNMHSVDNPKIIKIKNTPKIISVSKNSGFINLKYPYHAACLMDRELMKEYTNSNLISIDYGFHHKIMRTLYPIKELANVIIGYINVPAGFHNRYFLPFINKNQIPNYCLIKHLDNKYSKMKTWHYGNIKIKNLLNN